MDCQVAATMSVCAKSSPLENKGSPVVLAKAYAKQSPKFNAAGWSPFALPYWHHGARATLAGLSSQGRHPTPRRPLFHLDLPPPWLPRVRLGSLMPLPALCRTAKSAVGRGCIGRVVWR